jgi:tetratricopeptide (TPR) repeat protein
MSDFDELQLDKGASPKLKVSGDDELKMCGDETVAVSHGVDDCHEQPDAAGETDGQNNGTGKQAGAAQNPADSPHQPIGVLKGIRERAENQKKSELQSHPEFAMESNTIASLGKPVFILIFLLVLPWVISHGVISDWSCMQRQRCNLLGQSALHNGQFDKAKAYFEAALVSLNNGQAENVPDRKAYSLSRFGAVAYAQGDLKGAASQYELAGNTALDPGQKNEYLCAAATVQSQLGNFAESEELAKRAMALAALNQSQVGQFGQGHAFLSLAFVHYKEGKYQQALLEATKAKTLLSYWGGSGVEGLIGDIYRAMGDKAKALESYKTGSVAITDRARDYYQRGDFRAFKGDYSRSTEYYVNQLRSKALARYLQGDQTGARIFIQAASKIAPMIDLSGEDDVPPIFSKDSIAQLKDMIAAGGK